MYIYGLCGSKTTSRGAAKLRLLFASSVSVGVLWNNIGPSDGLLTQGIVSEVRTLAGRLGVTVILLRASISINWNTVRPMLKNVAGLVFGAFGLESVVHGFFAS